MARFHRLVRFEDPEGQIQHGELNSDTPWDADLMGIEVKLFTSGTTPWSDEFQLTGKSAKIAKVCLKETYRASADG